MENLSFFEKINKIFFIGIGGISLSALAIIMKNLGFDVAGSDIQTSEITEKLIHRGISVKRGHKKKHIKDFKPDLVVYSGAIKEENIELRFARLHNIFCLERSSFIERILPYYNQVISISGTHGKTTTTSMIGEIFINAKLPITLHIGGESTNLESNCKSLGNEYFITEACEYRKSFLKIPSDLGVILNIEEDHPDCYKNLEEISKTFSGFVDICTNVVINTKYISCVKEKPKRNLITFSLREENTKNDSLGFYTKNIRKLKNGGYSFSVYKNNVFYERFRLNIFGKHNIYNALASICVADYFNIDKEIIKTTLAKFSGVKRRFERVTSKILPCTIYFDYAHHPTEIKKLLDETKILNMPTICVFQPHTYSRTKKYFKEFLSCFEGIYQIVFYKTYSAREKKIKGGSAKDLYSSLKDNDNVFYFNTFKKILRHLKKYAKSNCLVLFVGAGDIYDIKKWL